MLSSFLSILRLSNVAYCCTCSERNTLSYDGKYVKSYVGKYVNSYDGKYVKSYDGKYVNSYDG